MSYLRTWQFLATLSIIFVLLLVFSKKFEHSVAGLPHWATSCPKNATPILVIGQSQASNTGPRRHISFSGSRAFADGKCYYMRDPMPGTAGRGGTIWPIFADMLSKRVVVANIAISGSAIKQWTMPEQIAKFRRTLADFRAAGYPKPIIIWMQGETDGASRTDAHIYYAHLHKILQIAPNNHWIITRESICYTFQNKWAPLDVARDKIASEFPKVTIGPDLDAMGLEFRQTDHCHLTDEGQELLAKNLSATAQYLIRH